MNNSNNNKKIPKSNTGSMVLSSSWLQIFLNNSQFRSQKISKSYNSISTNKLYLSSTQMLIQANRTNLQVYIPKDLYFYIIKTLRIFSTKISPKLLCLAIFKIRLFHAEREIIMETKRINLLLYKKNLHNNFIPPIFSSTCQLLIFTRWRRSEGIPAAASNNVFAPFSLSVF